jgi:hypothetical protein
MTNTYTPSFKAISMFEKYAVISTREGNQSGLENALKSALTFP